MILPHKQAPINPLVSGSVRQVLLADAPREVRVDISLDRICTINLQDNRTYGSATYGALVECFKGPLGKGKSASLQVSLGLSSQPVTGQTVLTLHPAQKRYELEGFGGNYCFGIESPVATYTLRNLRSVWARSEMLLREWEPENDNASASQVNWEYFKAQDKPGSKLRRRFLFDQQIQKQGLRQVVSIWQLPNWLYTDPARQTDDHGRRLAPDKWAELLESIGSYLLHAKRAYGVEPDLFSFNEADLGVYVQFSAEEQRDMIKRVGTILQKLGLKTKLLVADSHSPRDTSLYALPTADDPQALSFAGGLSFHSWGGASAAQYKAWADLAGRLRLPLIVAEAGLDPEVWRTGMFDTYPYGLSEARMYQELLLHARPQAILYWEYTSDYRLVREKNAGAAKEPELTPTARFWFLKHFSDLTPPKAAALTTGSSQSDVLLTAFAGSGKDASALTLHILNTGAARQAAIFGVPVTVTTLRAVLTSDGQSFQELPPVAVIKVPLVVDLPARSLLTLTTLAK
jgi:O-glycosyl hydrolase